METFRVQGAVRQRAPGKRPSAITGVNASGNLEVLVERVLEDDQCLVEVATAITGFRDLWQAETAMLTATGGVNTHRGAIFGLGLLCAAAGTTARLSDNGVAVVPRKLGSIVVERWGKDIRRAPVPLHSRGSAALRRYGAGGARAEAAAGFPSVYNIGLPALRLGRTMAPAVACAAYVQTCFAHIASVRDTSRLCGKAGGWKMAVSLAALRHFRPKIRS